MAHTHQLNKNIKNKKPRDMLPLDIPVYCQKIQLRN